MTKLFISHSSRDDAFVRDLRAALVDLGQDGWIDSRELRGGDPLLTEIQKAIDEASAYAVVVSTDALQSKWVGKELKYALKIQEQRGKDKFPVIPLSLNETKLGVLEEFFDEEPIYIAVSSQAGGVETAMNSLLVALGVRVGADVPVAAQNKAEPLEELVLELTDLKFSEQDGERRASARARLVYDPASESQREVTSERSWRFIAPISAAEMEELRWYLEKYPIPPSEYFRDRARKVEENLVKWGQILHKKAIPAEHTANVMNAWSKIADDADRRFSVYVDAALEADAPEAEVTSAREAATLLLGLPWELLHDGEAYLFQGAKPMRVRRRLPNTKVLDVPAVATPIRILLITARPEDDECDFLDHRTSALPLVEATESLPGLVKIQILSPPTLPALRAELDRARSENKPYHVVHFDGYGGFDRELGMGGLCFENPEDTDKLENRGHVTVFTNELGPLLRDHRIPLVFLEACQTAQAEKASESVASEFLKVGVASVVAMSHNLLLETTARFVRAFYKTLAEGERVGDAMLAGQRELKDNTFRGRYFGSGEVRLEDWFVPVLYQEKDDPVLFKTTPAKQTQEDFRAALAARLGDLPPVPETGFIGRSRELLTLQRLLREGKYAVVRGQGGEGMTALAAEFARWMVRSQRMRRSAFVSLETHGSQRAIVEAIGKQLVQKNFSAEGDLEIAILQLERALREQPALLVFDNMESILPPPFVQNKTAETSADVRQELKAILALCERLLNAGDTRVLFTSREALPAPFDAERHRRELYQLDYEDAVRLIERGLNPAGDNGGSSGDAAREEIEQLVEAVHGHARTLTLLTPSLREHGVEGTRKSLTELMASMEKSFSGSREKSVFASVELSLRRLSEANRNRARVLAVFHGGVQTNVLRNMMQWEEADVDSLAEELITTGLATPNDYEHLTLNPALCPYLRSVIEAPELESLTAKWVEEMRSFVRFLVHEQTKDAEAVATLTTLEVPNLFALLDLAQDKFDAEETIELASLLYVLFQMAGRPRLLARIGQVRDSAAAAPTDKWTFGQFEVARSRIEEQLRAGKLREAFEAAQKLHQRAMEAGEQAYPGSDYHLASACGTLATVMKAVGDSKPALSLLAEALKRFETIAAERPGIGAEEMAAKCFTEQGDCLWTLGRLDEAMAAYEEGIRRYEQVGDQRGIAGGKSQIGSICLVRGSYEEALQAFEEALEPFEQLNEPNAIAVILLQIGKVHRHLGDPEAAEDAYRESLAIAMQVGDVGHQANTLNELGILYQEIPGRLEEAAGFFQQAVNKSVETGDITSEGFYRNSLADIARLLKQFDTARQEVVRAIDCGLQFSNTSQLWSSWGLLATIETEAGNLGEAANAQRKAIECYVEYRRRGGKNPSVEGIVSDAVTEHLLAGDSAAAKSYLQEASDDPELPSNARTFISALQEIVAGNRDRALADAPDLHFGMAAEILLLIETLETEKKTPPTAKEKPTTKKRQTKKSS